MTIIPIRDLDGVRRNMTVASDIEGEFPKHLATTTEDRLFSTFNTFNTVDDWEVIQTGSGMTIGAPAGGGVASSSPYLPISSGVTAADRTVIMSRSVFRAPVEVRVGVSASQRIANNTLRVGFLECTAEGVLVTDTVFNTVPELMNARNGTMLDFSSLNTIQMNVMCRQGGGGIDNLLVNFNGYTTLATGTAPDFLIASYVALSIERDRVSARTFTANSPSNPGTQVSRDSNAPNPTRHYRVAIIVENGAVAPASTTDWRLHFVNLMDATRFEVSARHSGSLDSSRSFPVNVLNQLNVNPLVLTEFSLPNSAATTNATLVKSSSGVLFNIAASNLSVSARFLKIYKKATAPIPGTDIPVLTIPLPANSFTPINLGAQGLRLATGIGFAITALGADSNTTAIAANDVKLTMNFS